MIYILYSNDYELHLGGNHLVETEVLIRPTATVLGICEELHVPMTLFCDVMCLWRYRDLGFDEFPDAVDRQIEDALDRGHDVQAHVHPHWATASIERSPDGASRYEFAMEDFLLGSVAERESDDPLAYCTDLFRRARSYLEDLLRPWHADYECIAYRAGGYGLQPNTDVIIEALIAAGYRIDSSIVPGMSLHSNVNRIDFTQAPRRANYRIDPEHGLSGRADSGLLEIPVLALRPGEARDMLARGFAPRLAEYIVRNKIRREQPSGFGIQSVGAPTGFRHRMKTEIGRILHGAWTLELGPDWRLMVDGTRRYLEHYVKGGGDVFFALSTHSKALHHAAFDALSEYHRALERTYGSALCAITYRQALELWEGRDAGGS